MNYPQCFVLIFSLLQCALLAQTGGQAGNPGSVQGRVTDAVSGNGIGNASVHLFPREVPSAGGQQGLSTTSLDDGSFRFDSVPSGVYLTMANHPDYRSLGGRNQTMTVSDGAQVTGLSIQMSPLTSVSGKVLDDEARPVPGASVQLYSTYNSRGRTQLLPRGNATSNRSGEYLIKKVTPGEYYITADPAPESDDATQAKHGTETESNQSEPATKTNSLRAARTFYPKALTPESASTIEVVAGNNVADADIHMQRAAMFHVRGKIETLLPGALQKGATLTLAPRNTLPSSGLGMTEPSQADKSFDFGRVQSGSYTLWVLGNYSSGVEQSRPNSRHRLLARQDLDVNGSDLNGIHLSLMPPVNLTGQIIFNNQPSNVNFTQLRIVLQAINQVSLGSSQSVTVRADGSFALQDVVPGEYMVRVANVPTGAYIQSLTFNRQNVLTSGIDLSQGGSGEIQVVLRSGAAEVDGSVSPASGSQAVSGTALLVPEALAADASGLLVGGIQQGGTFAIRNVPPGRYYAFAIEQWSGVWQNADFLHQLERQATAIEVSENAHLQVQLSIITLEQLQPIASQLDLTVQ